MIESWVWCILPLAGLAKLVLGHVLVGRRERQALRLSAKVYEAGGDPAEIIRAVNGRPLARGSDGTAAPVQTGTRSRG